MPSSSPLEALSSVATLTHCAKNERRGGRRAGPRPTFHRTVTCVTHLSRLLRQHRRGARGCAHFGTTATVKRTPCPGARDQRAVRAPEDSRVGRTARSPRPLASGGPSAREGRAPASNLPGRLLDDASGAAGAARLVASRRPRMRSGRGPLAPVCGGIVEHPRELAGGHRRDVTAQRRAQNRWHRCSLRENAHRG
jgi:hypothetical protein